jgi:hypothetical protein
MPGRSVVVAYEGDRVPNHEVEPERRLAHCGRDSRDRDAARGPARAEDVDEEGAGVELSGTARGTDRVERHHEVEEAEHVEEARPRESTRSAEPSTRPQHAARVAAARRSRRDHLGAVREVRDRDAGYQLEGDRAGETA